MSEWLTTGEMIDRLKVGEVAKSATVRYGNELLSKEIEYVDGRLRYKGYKKDFQINDITQKMKWLILPNYVSFEEAMKAQGEGKEIYFHGGNTLLGEPLKYPGGAARNMNGTKFTNYSLHTLFHGKWTIEE